MTALTRWIQWDHCHCATATPPCHSYLASDNLHSPMLRQLTPSDIENALPGGLAFDAQRGEGVIFHMISGVAEFGKIG
jgi:hypothetical protein